MRMHSGIAGFGIFLVGMVLILIGGVRLSLIRRGIASGSRSAKIVISAILLGGICIIISILLLASGVGA